MIQLYGWYGGKSAIRTVKAKMDYAIWLEMERARLSKSNRKVEIRSEVWKNGKRKRKVLSLWVESYCSVPRCRKIATREVDGVGMLCDECTRAGGRKEAGRRKSETIRKTNP